MSDSLSTLYCANKCKTSTYMHRHTHRCVATLNSVVNRLTAVVLWTTSVMYPTVYMVGKNKEFNFLQLTTITLLLCSALLHIAVAERLIFPVNFLSVGVSVCVKLLDSGMMCLSSHDSICLLSKYIFFIINRVLWCLPS